VIAPDQRETPARTPIQTAGANFWRELPQPVIGLAPMDGVTDAAFRSIVVRQGAPDVTLTEFTNVGDICHGRHTLLSFLYGEGERPVVAQLYGKDPDLFYQAAHVVCELGFDGLDINMGCPSKNVASSGSGAGLIRTPDLAGEIIRATRQGVLDWANGQTLRGSGLKAARVELIASMNARQKRVAPPRRVIPVSVKTRLGYDCVIVERWISRLLDERPVVISLHGRTLEQMYRGAADWNAIAHAVQLARGTGTLVFGNGDVQTMQDVVTRVRNTGVHGVLIGRGALGTPWFFRTKELARAQANHTRLGLSHPPNPELAETSSLPLAPARPELAETSSLSIAPAHPELAETSSVPEVVLFSRAGGSQEGMPAPLDPTLSLEERFRIMIEHAREFESIFGAEYFPRMRKHLGWYCKGFSHAASLRASMVRASSSRDVEGLLAVHRAHADSPGTAAILPVTAAAPCA